MKLSYKAARVSAGFTLETASEEIGVSISTLSSYEHGNTKPKIDTIIKMSNLYGCELSDFKEVSGE